VINPDGIDTPTANLLRTCLELSVPIWIEKLRDRDPSYILERARECGQHISERGDVLQFRGKTPKERAKTAEAFNRLAEGLACAALVAPGGVTFLGTTWAATPTLPR